MSAGAPASAARVYDWYLGGNHHWAVDRELPDWRPETPPTPIDTETRPFAWCAVARRPTL